MPSISKTLYDSNSPFDGDLSRHDASGQIAEGDWSIRWNRLCGGLSDGVTIVTLSSGSMTVTVCPTRGMGVLHASCNDVPIGWQSPVNGPVHPQFVDLTARNGLGWLDGFSELLCRCGLSFNGPPGVDDGAKSPIESQLTLHGRIANLPANRVTLGFDAETDTLWVEGSLVESTLFGPHLELVSRLRLPLKTNRFDIQDTVTNHASSPTEVELLYHINVGRPFLEEGSQLTTAFEEMSPRDSRAAEGVDSFDTYEKPTPGFAEQVYYFDPLTNDDGRATVLLANAVGNLGLSVQFDPQQLPCLSQWKCTQPEADGYVTGIEPGTNFPNFKSFEREQGRVVNLDPGESYRVDLRLAVHTDATTIAELADSIAALQSTVSPTVHAVPSPPFANV